MGDGGVGDGDAAPGTARRAADALAGLCRWGTGLAFAVLIVAVSVQVVGRTLGSSPVWTEELTRFALLWLAAFGTGVALRTGDLVNVDLVSEALPGGWPWRLRLLSALLIALLCAAILWPAWRYTAIGALQTSPAMGMRMTWAHASVLALIALLGAFAALRALAMIAGSEDGRPAAPEGVSGEDVPGGGVPGGGASGKGLPGGEAAE